MLLDLLVVDDDRDRVAGVALGRGAAACPYLAWILYASTLNWGDAVLISLA